MCLQRLASLSMCHERGTWPRGEPLPLVALRLPDRLPRLQHLRFGGYDSWDVFHKALWPLAVLGAETASEISAEGDAASAHAAGCALVVIHGVIVKRTIAHSYSMD